MRYRPRWTGTAALLGGSAIWALVLVSCMTTSRTMVAPPMIAGATYVGSQKCAQCHEDTTKHFDDATHAKLAAAESKLPETGCESCHGPGSLHVKAGGGAGTIVNPGNSPETCFRCHLDKRGEFTLPSTHPVLAGKMGCGDCHDPHSGNAVASVTDAEALNAACLKCHTSQGGPYVFEHEASREGCVVCHSPHGSVNAKMLKARNQNLCLQCHFQEQTSPTSILIGGREHATFLPRGTCWSAGCHEAVHGSHVSSSLRF